jgi:hypothetical protein
MEQANSGPPSYETRHCCVAACFPVSGLYFQETIVGLHPSRNRAGDLALVVLAL